VTEHKGGQNVTNPKVSVVALFFIAIGLFIALNLGSDWLYVTVRTPCVNCISPIEAMIDLSMIARLVVSVVLLAAALFVILTKKYGPQDKHWAYGTLGTIVGYWLKP
jgi:hypothetical protein